MNADPPRMVDVPRPSAIVPAGDAPAFSMAGDIYAILVDGQQTGGAYSLMEARVPEGGGPPPHIQSREDEGFFVLDGRFRFFLGDETRELGPGDFANVSRGTPHSFRGVGPGKSRMLILNSPAGIEEFFRRVGLPAESLDADAPPISGEEIGRLANLAPEYGIEILKPQ